jgi:hypothetical protein
LFIFIFFLVEGSYRSNREVEGQLSKAYLENEELKDQFANRPGPQLWIGYNTFGDLIVQNNGGGIAHSIVLRIPDDGSWLTSKTTPIVREKDFETVRAEDVGRITCQYIIGCAKENEPVLISCIDDHGRIFEYFFEPDKQRKYQGFLFKGRRCLGQPKQF